MQGVEVFKELHFKLLWPFIVDLTFIRYTWYMHVQIFNGFLFFSLQIKIKLQKIAVEPSPRPNMRPHTLPGLVRLVSGEGVGKSPPNLQDVPHAAMYLTLDCNSENMSDKVTVKQLLRFNFNSAGQGIYWKWNEVMINSS